MKKYLLLSIALVMAVSFQLMAQKQATASNTANKLFIDVHHLAPGSVTFNDVAGAHAKDLATQERYGVKFIKYWVDEKNGDVYCLSAAKDSAAITHTHQDAHGLLPQEVHMVEDGDAAIANTKMPYYLDIHQLGANGVKAADVEKAHQKDLGVQNKYGVRFINYWVAEKAGLVYCLSQATDSKQVVETHREAHGLLPATIVEVKEGQ